MRKRIILAKYEQSFLEDIPTKGKYNSLKAPWRSIIKGIEWFLPQIKWKINNVEAISFWHGYWHEDNLLYIRKPSLYALTKKWNLSKDLWNEDTMEWDFNPRRPLRSMKIQSWEDLKSTIHPLTHTQSRDTPKCSLNTNVCFSIASIKMALTDRIQGKQNNLGYETFQHPWKTTIPKKCKFFIWSLLHECINTA